MDKKGLILPPVGAAAGYVAGRVVGNRMFRKVLNKSNADIITKVLVNSLSKDDYVRYRIMANVENVTNMKSSKMQKEYRIIAEKAKADYNVISNLFKKAAKVKLKWIAGLSVAGLVIGSVLGLKK